MVEDPGMSEEQVEEAGTLGQLEGVAALVAQQRRHVNCKVLHHHNNNDRNKREEGVSADQPKKSKIIQYMKDD